MAEGKALRSNLLCLQVIEFVRVGFVPSSNPLRPSECPKERGKNICLRVDRNPVQVKLEIALATKPTIGSAFRG